MESQNDDETSSLRTPFCFNLWCDVRLTLRSPCERGPRKAAFDSSHWNSEIPAELLRNMQFFQNWKLCRHEARLTLGAQKQLQCAGLGLSQLIPETEQSWCQGCDVCGCQAGRPFCPPAVMEWSSPRCKWMLGGSRGQGQTVTDQQCHRQLGRAVRTG